jgi:hypothetical protein
MSPRRRLILFALIVAAAVILAVQRPWEKVAPPRPPAIGAPNLDVLNPAKLVALRCLLAGGGPCSVTIVGHSGETLSRLTFNLSAAGTPSGSQSVAGPFTIDTVNVERGGKTHRQEFNVTILGGQTREVRVNPDDTVELVTP